MALYTLPTELVHEIISHIRVYPCPEPCYGDHRWRSDLVHLLLTCRRFYQIVVPILNNSIKPQNQLYMAIKKHIPSLALTAFRRGADANGPPSAGGAVALPNDIKLPYSWWLNGLCRSPTGAATLYQDLEILRMLFERGGTPTNEGLRFALVKGYTEVVRLYLVYISPEELNKVQLYQWGVLHDSVRHGRVPETRMLLEKGADVNIFCRGKTMMESLVERFVREGAQLAALKVVLDWGVNIEGDERIVRRAQSQQTQELLIEYGAVGKLHEDFHIQDTIWEIWTEG